MQVYHAFYTTHDEGHRDAGAQHCAGFRLGIVSDTHGLLRPQVIDMLEGCDAILHAGDVDRQDLLDRLGRIAPTYVVRGNTDKEWADDLPQSLSLNLYGLDIFMVHKKKEFPPDTGRYDLIIYGHSHRYEEKRDGSVFYLNPGSCGPVRFNQDITMAVLTGQRGTKDFQVEKIVIPRERKALVLPERDMKTTIQLVIRETKKGTAVPAIARKLKIDEDLAEQICRLYLTHPGVTADGIMTKMGL